MAPPVAYVATSTTLLGMTSPRLWVRQAGPDWPLRLLSLLSASIWINYYNYTLNTEPSQLCWQGLLKRVFLTVGEMWAF